MNAGQIIGFLAATLFFGICTFVAIVFLRKRHPGEVYLIWYVISFLFILFLGLDIIAQNNNVTLTATCGSYESICKTVYDYLTDFDGEVKLLIAILALAIVPQFLAYILSGLSGSASAPKFVSAVTKYALWSLIKFSAAFAGILLADATARLYFGKPVVLRDFGLVVFFISVAFSFALYAMFDIETLPPPLHNDLKNNLFARALENLHLFCTRNVSRE
jgi:hypothetical protein